MNNAYRDLLVGQAVKAVSAAQYAKSVTHAGLKGQLREIVVRDLLRPLLPFEFVVGTGQIVSAYGDTSNQIDVVVCDRRIVPPILYEEVSGIFLIESSLVTVEVKSTIDVSDLQAAHDSAARCRTIRASVCIGSDWHWKNRDRALRRNPQRCRADPTRDLRC